MTAVYVWRIADFREARDSPPGPLLVNVADLAGFLGPTAKAGEPKPSAVVHLILERVASSSATKFCNELVQIKFRGTKGFVGSADPAQQYRTQGSASHQYPKNNSLNQRPSAHCVKRTSAQA
jgi:hypothetical protein